MFDVPIERQVIHPGEILPKEFLLAMNLTQRKLTEAMNVPYQRLNETFNGRRGVTPSTALRPAKFLATLPVFG